MTTALPSNITGLVSYGAYLNSSTVTDGFFGPIVLVTIFLICVILLRQKSQEQNFTVSSMITLLIGALMVVMEWIGSTYVIAFFGLSVIFYFILRARNAPYP